MSALASHLAVQHATARPPRASRSQPPVINNFQVLQPSLSIIVPRLRNDHLNFTLFPPPPVPVTHHHLPAAPLLKSVYHPFICLSVYRGFHSKLYPKCRPILSSRA